MDCWPADTTFYLEPDTTRVETAYLYYWLSAHPLSGDHAKTTLPSLQRPDLEQLELSLPPMEQQRRIARILSTILRASAVEASYTAAKRATLGALAQLLFRNALADGTDIVPLRDSVVQVQSGDWGSSEPAEGLVECIVLRATDFWRAAAGNVSSAPRRYLRGNSAKSHRLGPDDFLVEMSGGSTDQPTGRLMRVPTLDASAPVAFSNFVKRIRIRPDIEPGFFVSYWNWLYSCGGTRPYEKRTTGIRNFKLDDFLESEVIPLPASKSQKSIAHAFAALNLAIVAGADRERHLEGVFDAASRLLLGDSR
jgi:type I restriction enzyme S subunit